MTVAQIQALALANCHVKSSQVNTTNLLTWFNLIRKDLGNVIVSDVDENFFFQIWKRDAIVDTADNQENGEYPYPEADDDSAGALKVNRVLIKPYDTDTYFKPCREVKPQNLPYDWLYYMTNQSKSEPIYFIADESIFIAPKFKAADLPTSPSGNAQIKLTGIAKLIDLTAVALSTAILIPDDFHHLISLGMEEYVYKSRKSLREASNSKSNYEFEKQNMIDKLTNRDNSQMQATLPDDTGLQYAQ